MKRMGSVLYVHKLVQRFSSIIRSKGSRTVPGQHRASLINQFVESLGVSGSDAAAPTDGCKADCTLLHRLVKNMQHFGADIKGP